MLPTELQQDKQAGAVRCCADVCLCICACRGVEAGVPGRSLLEQCTDCDVRMNMQGSDHAPVHADWDLLAPLPAPESAPPLSTRYMFTGVLHCVKVGLGFGFFS